ncbi:hypothetical protein AFAEC_1938 [Aliarcobacter faecis]|uniref:hypothetical protein n=1 Tax=Aliarcobacter faecis TaxID=1564138 RepID=UPI00047C24DF|nr:hypothetical protein [Aliarcobacter faecis]QKF74089.1 hypothetical protein AFAEC_1938 [Aliarcobacter faecis]
MNSKISFNENNIICDIKDVEDVHNLVMKLILETEEEMLFSSSIFSTCKRRFLKDLAFNLHETRRNIELYIKQNSDQKLIMV